MNHYNPLCHLAPDVLAARDKEWDILFQSLFDKFAASALDNKLPDDWDEIRMTRYFPRLAMDGKTMVYLSPACLILEFHELIHFESRVFKRENVSSLSEAIKIIARKYNLQFNQ